MKRILKKRIVPLLCAGLLLCTPHTIAYAAAGETESTTAQTEETASSAEETAPPPAETPPAEETAPPPVETSPAEETAPPPAETSPAEETAPPAEEITPPAETAPPETILPKEPPAEENTEPASYSVEIAWESLEFEYAPLWNPDEHCYDGWESTETPITVTNMSENGVPIRVTLTFVPTEEMGTAVVFSPCEDDPNPDEFTFSDGQVTFLLPRDADGEAQATVNLSLSGGDPTGWESELANQIGAIKTEIMPLDEQVQDLEVVLPPGVSDIPLPPATDLPLPETELPIVEEPAEKPTEPSQPAPTEPSQPKTPAEPEPLPPKAEEEQSPEAKPEKPLPEQDNTPEVPPLPKHDAKEESQAAPSSESGAPPQEEPQ